MSRVRLDITIVCMLFIALVNPGFSAEPTYCEVYCPGHFGNWYEVAGRNQMRDMMIEAKAWGYTRYGDWFDALDCDDPFDGDRQYDLGTTLRDRKRIHFQTAGSLGLATDLIITPNHVYTDQLKPAWLAESGGRIFGQLVCPSKPEAREVILKNQKNLFADLARAGVRLTAINLGPYDYGGCKCQQCNPWIITFAKLAVDIHKIARSYHPDVELHFIGWWWSAQEHKLFAEWVDKNAPNTTASMALHIPYGKTSVGDVLLPKNCNRHAFVHIGYADKASPRDVYGKTGPVIAARRLEQTVRQLKAQGVTGVTAYSEGIYDDVNKALLGGLWSGRYADARAVLTAYAKRYFEADEKQARAWVEWLIPWGEPFTHNAAGARKSFGKLSGDPRNWRRRQWELKADLFAAHQAIMAAGDEWTPERLAMVDEFWATEETLQREVYSTGPLRHILAQKFIGLPWYESWKKHQQANAAESRE